MKKLIIILIFSFCGISAFSQVPYFPLYPTQYGQRFNRIIVLHSLGVPVKDTLETSTTDTTAQFFYHTKDSSFYGWVNGRGFFKIGEGGGGKDSSSYSSTTQIDTNIVSVNKLNGGKTVWVFDGVVGGNSGGGTSYTLPTASASVLGGVKIGSGLSIDGTGVLTADIPTNNTQLINGANYTTVSITDNRYQPLENQRLSKNNNVYFNQINTVPSGGDSVEIYGGVVVAHNSFGGYAALNHDSNGGIVTIENKNGFDAFISGKNITSSQLYLLPNTPNGTAGNTLPISVNGNFADVSGNIVIPSPNLTLQDVASNGNTTSYSIDAASFSTESGNAQSALTAGVLALKPNIGGFNTGRISADSLSSADRWFLLPAYSTSRTYNYFVTSVNGVYADITGNVSTLIISTSTPTTAPNFIGQQYIDTTNKKLYFATGTSSSSDWTIAN